jgi:hypothetical protein
MDLLSFGENDLSVMKQTFTNILKIELDDGLNFDLTKLQAIKIKEVAKYQGVRLNGYAFLDGEYLSNRYWFWGCDRKKYKFHRNSNIFRRIP